ncbi:MEDS domain-containing protein [Massilia aurea]|uniref:MEDS domain-containing protein n=1 Tax=Massilia aurea TaxID=373040 RepID=UPI003463788C
MSIPDKPVHLAGKPLTHACHACAFFHTDEEKYRVLMPFILEGFERGDLAAHIVNPAHRAAHLAELAHAGVDTAAAKAQGQLAVRTWDETYLQDGKFDQERMIASLLALIAPENAPPGKISRNIADMAWMNGARPDARQIVAYEARLNQALPHHHNPIVCTYDLTHFSADVVIDIIRTHPMVIIGGILQENPFFVPPEQMLRELEERSLASAMPAGAPQ